MGIMSLFKNTTEMCPICNIPLENGNAYVKIRHCGADYVVTAKAMSCNECGYQKLLSGKARLDHVKEMGQKDTESSDDDACEDEMDEPENDEASDNELGKGNPSTDEEDERVINESGLENTGTEPAKARGFIPKSKLLGISSSALEKTEDHAEPEADTNVKVSGYQEEAAEDKESPNGSVVIPLTKSDKAGEGDNEEIDKKRLGVPSGSPAVENESAVPDDKSRSVLEEADKAVEKIVADSLTDTIINETEALKKGSEAPVVTAAANIDPDEEMIKHLIMGSPGTGASVNRERETKKGPSENQKPYNDSGSGASGQGPAKKTEGTAETSKAEPKENRPAPNGQNGKQHEHAKKSAGIHAAQNPQNMKHADSKNGNRNSDGKENQVHKDQRDQKQNGKDRNDGKNKGNGAGIQHNHEQKSKNMIPENFGTPRTPSGIPGSFPKMSGPAYMPHGKGNFGYSPYGGKIPSGVNLSGMTNPGNTSGGDKKEANGQNKENGDKNVPSHIEENTRVKTETKHVKAEANDHTGSRIQNENLQKEAEVPEKLLSENKKPVRNPEGEASPAMKPASSDKQNENIVKEHNQESKPASEQVKEITEHTDVPDKDSAVSENHNKEEQSKDVEQKPQTEHASQKVSKKESGGSDPTEEKQNHSSSETVKNANEKAVQGVVKSSESDAGNGDEEEIEKDLVIKFSEKMPSGVVKTIKPLSNAVEKRNRRIFVGKERRFLQTHIPEKKVIIEGLIYDTNASEMFLRMDASYGLDRPCVHYNYRTSNGNFFRCTVCYGKEDSIRVLEEYDVKRLLQDYPDLYERFFPGTIQNA